jgi:hypothetical protein
LPSNCFGEDDNRSRKRCQKSLTRFVMLVGYQFKKRFRTEVLALANW